MEGSAVWSIQDLASKEGAGTQTDSALCQTCLSFSAQPLEVDCAPIILEHNSSVMEL